MQWPDQKIEEIFISFEVTNSRFVLIENIIFFSIYILLGFAEPQGGSLDG